MTPVSTAPSISDTDARAGRKTAGRAGRNGHWMNIEQRPEGLLKLIGTIENYKVTRTEASFMFTDIAQYASVAGAAFTISASFAGILSIGGEGALMISAATWGTIACALGLVGAVLTLAAVIGMWIFYVPKWKEWLQDIPLNVQNKGKKPGFANLQETLQKLANAIASAGLKTDSAGVPG